MKDMRKTTPTMKMWALKNSNISWLKQMVLELVFLEGKKIQCTNENIAICGET